MQRDADALVGTGAGLAPRRGVPGLAGCFKRTLGIVPRFAWPASAGSRTAALRAARGSRCAGSGPVSPNGTVSPGSRPGLGWGARVDRNKSPRRETGTPGESLLPRSMQRGADALVGTGAGFAQRRCPRAGARGLYGSMYACTLPGMAPFLLEPLAFFLTWTTYASWLPGDRRGWADGGGFRVPNPRLRRLAASRCLGDRVVLGTAARGIVERIIADHCRRRGWHLHAVHCRTEHVHVVVTADGRPPHVVIGELKAWSSRALADLATASGQSRWRRTWTRGGSCRRLYDVTSVEHVVTYVRECQDKPR
jgi:REP element-mobilizing transposase RayT